MQSRLHCLLRRTPAAENLKHHTSVPVAFIPNTNIIYQQCSFILEESAHLTADCRKAKAVHCLLLMFNYHGFVSIWNKLLKLYLRGTNSPLACNLFDSMPERDVVTYNTLISASIRGNDIHKAVGLYSKMKEENIQANHITFGSLIRITHRGDIFHSQVIRLGLSSNVYVGSSLIEKYANENKLDNAIKAFSEITELDMVSWNLMIDGCASNKSKDHAIRLFTCMLDQNFLFDGFTLTSVIKTCSKPIDLHEGMCLHCLAVKSGLILETPVSNSLITMYSRCEKGMSCAKNIFSEIAYPNVISWTAILSGLMQNDQNVEAAGLYKEMLVLGVKENHFLFATVLPAYGNLANLDQGRQIHARVTKSVFSQDPSVQNALIDMYSKCGCLSDANLVFSTMEYRDVISYTTIITCYGHHGEGKSAISVLKNMMDEGLCPDDVTFLACLCACSHSFLLEEGIKIFRMMVNSYQLQPRKEHFSCIIDMLGRAGRLKEAEKFIERMGFELDADLWETLLGACSIHGEMELGEKSVKRLMALDPERHGSYVLLANVYANRELWYKKGEVRDKLDLDGIQKEVGSSQIVQQKP